MTFGEKLRESRKISNLTQKQLADRIGAKHNSVSDWENDKNKPDPDTIELLCGVLGISPNYLLNSNSDDFSLLEKEIIKKYRDLDDHGSKMVDFVLGEEWERSKQLREDSMYNFKPDPLVMVAESTTNYGVKDDTDQPIQPHTIAAHLEGKEPTSDELEEIAEFEKFIKNRKK